MRSRLINGQSNFVESTNLHNSSTPIVVDIIKGEIRHNLTQCNDVSIGGRILGEQITENGHLLVGRRLASFAVECRTVEILGKQIIVDPAAKGCGRTTGIGTNVKATLVVLDEIVLKENIFDISEMQLRSTEYFKEQFIIF